MRHVALLLALAALAACSATPLARVTSNLEADRLIQAADAKLRAGNPQGAVRILDDVVRRFPGSSNHDQALYDLARALVLSGNSASEYRQAAAQLDRLLREHPTSSRALDARAWRAVLGAYVGRTAELNRVVERLKAIDFELERRPQP